MRLRIATAIFLCVAVTLIACGAVVFWAAKSVLLADLDKSLLARAASRPELVDSAGGHSEADHPLESGDRYVIRDLLDGRTLHSSHRDRGSTAAPAEIELLGRGEFSTLANGTIVRTVRVRGYARPSPDASPVQVMIGFSGSTDHYFAMLARLRWVLIFGGAVGGAVAAGVAWLLAGTALRPLNSAAQVIGSIDENTLHRRLDTSGLPSELVPISTTLNGLLASLDLAMRRRQQFLADAAHELRTPVAALLTEIEIALRRTRDAEGYRRSLQAALPEARFLRRLVDALLRHARSETPGTAAAVELVNLAAIVRECAGIVRPLADERSVTVVVVDPTTDAMVYAAPERLRSIVLNLLANAVEYNRAGGSVRAEIEPAPGDRIRLLVSDSGVGIASEDVSRLFQPFFRAQPGPRHVEHLGLGLYLVQSHVKAIGGTIEVHSERDVGTTFRVLLPTASLQSRVIDSVSQSSHPVSEILRPAVQPVAGG